MKWNVVVVALLAAAAATSALAAANIKREQFAPTAADQQLAAKVVLHRSELKGSWRFALATRPSGDVPSCAGFDPDFSRFTITGHADSSFSASGQLVETQVDVFRSRAEAVADFKIGATAKGWACVRSQIEDQLRAGAAGGTVTTTRWKVTHPSPTMYDANGAFTIKTPTVAVPIVFEFVALQTGRGQVAFIVLTPAAKPIPEVSALARTLGARSRAL